jgi:hypothetical protein
LTKDIIQKTVTVVTLKHSKVKQIFQVRVYNLLYRRWYRENKFIWCTQFLQEMPPHFYPKCWKDLHSKLLWMHSFLWILSLFSGRKIFFFSWPLTLLAPDANLTFDTSIEPGQPAHSCRLYTYGWSSLNLILISQKLIMDTFRNGNWTYLFINFSIFTANWIKIVYGLVLRQKLVLLKCPLVLYFNCIIICINQK